MRRHVLVARLDNAGDVLLSGPAIRAVSATCERLTFLCGPQGESAAALLPGVDDIVVHRAPWIDPDMCPVDRWETLALVNDLGARRIDEAIILTSFHQSALPLALLLRLAGIPVIAAISEDYPGSLLDVRHSVPDDVHEVERALSLVGTLGYRLPGDDEGRLAIRHDRWPRLHPGLATDDPYVVVHPGASVPARAWPAERHAALVARLADEGWKVVITGGPDEIALTAAVAGGRRGVIDLGGATDLAGLAAVLERATVVVSGNTGPAHLAAAVETPVVSLFAPTVPARRWRPWRVPHVILGDQAIPCANCRARQCPVAGHPCLSSVSVEEALAAVDLLVPAAAVS
jgi:ADP-heptose:LPS heptosyltransferase